MAQKSLYAKREPICFQNLFERVCGKEQQNKINYSGKKKQFWNRLGLLMLFVNSFNPHPLPNEITISVLSCQFDTRFKLLHKSADNYKSFGFLLHALQLVLVYTKQISK